MERIEANRNSFGKIERVVEPKEFLKIIKTQSDKISGSRIILPKLGSDDLGKFKITYK